MAKTIANIVGVVFILVGIVGFFAHGMPGAHLSMAHNLVHLISGAAALYFGTKGSLSSARMFCMIFGAVYGRLGIVGFIAGNPERREFQVWKAWDRIRACFRCCREFWNSARWII